MREPKNLLAEEAERLKSESDFRVYARFPEDKDTADRLEKAINAEPLKSILQKVVEKTFAETWAEFCKAHPNWISKTLGPQETPE